MTPTPPLASPADPDVYDACRDLVVVIMAGGAGTRFWPASTESRPKQFLSFFGERTLLQQSFDRVASLVPPERVLVLTQERFRPLVRAQLPEVPEHNVVGEPERKDTAAAIALAAVLIAHRFGDVPMAVLTSDQLIEPTHAFQQTLAAALRGARASRALYTFGIAPTFAATGYGYLELGDEVQTDAGADEGVRHFVLRRFVEKPDEERARAYLDSGRFLWNSGMFVWSTSAILGEYERQLPGHLQALRPVATLAGGDAFATGLAQAFATLPRVSVDYGILEGAARVHCVRSDFGWSDVGGFLALGDHLPLDDAGNAHRGHLHTLDAQSNLVFAEDADETFALIGVSDLVVVRSGKRTLIVPKARAEEIKKLVERLPAEER